MDGVFGTRRASMGRDVCGSQATAVTGLRRARYRGLAKTHLDHVTAAAALNLIGVLNGHPLDRTSSHLAYLELALAA
jgi:hypothetical protein